MNSTTAKIPAHLPWYLMSGLVLLGSAVLLFWIFNPKAIDPSNGYSVDRLYNQGNTYAHAGKTGLAILDYERALLLAPADADVRANLRWTRDHAGLGVPAPSFAERIATVWSPNAFACAGSLGLLLLGCSVLLKNSWTSRSSVAAGLVLLALTAVSAVATWPKLNEAIVTSEASARISPVTNGDVSFKLKEGDIVAVEAEYHDFALVRTVTAQSGWVPMTELSRLVPTGANRPS